MVAAVSNASSPTGFDKEPPAHPPRQALMLVVGVLILIVALALISTFGSH
jgi:hypothetical protein